MNTYLDESLDSPVYYKILLNRNGLATIACLYDFDEFDYDQHKFFKTTDGTCVAFWNENNARRYLNEKFKPEYIDPEYRGPSENDPNNLFKDMLK